MRTQFICLGCTYTGLHRGSTCPMCGALMEHIELDAKKPGRPGAPFAAVPFIP